MSEFRELAAPAEHLPSRVRTLQIVVGSLAIGTLSFLAVALLLRSQNIGLAPAGQISPLVFLAIGAPLLLMQPLVGMLLVQAQRKVLAARYPLADWPQGEPPAALQTAVAQLFQGKSIVAAAMGEGGAFLMIVGFLITGSWLLLAAMLVFITTLLMQFPSLPRAEAWIDDQLRLLRQGAGL